MNRKKYLYIPRSIRRGYKRPLWSVFDSFGSDRITAVFHRIVNERKRQYTWRSWTVTTVVIIVLGRDTDGRIRALVPFPARTEENDAQLFNSSSLKEVDYNSTLGLHWTATSLVVRNNHGSYKLYMCSTKDLAIWIPCGEWFYSNQTPAAAQSIADYVHATFRSSSAITTSTMCQ
jgi:hypothetical protein